MKKKKFLFIFFIISVIFVTPAYGDTTNIALNISPRSVTIGNSIQISISNIPQSEAEYVVTIGQQTGQGSSRGTIELHIQVANYQGRFICGPAANTNKTPWKNLPNTCANNNNSFTFTGDLDTNKIGANLTTTNSLRYDVNVISPQSTNLTGSIQSDFVVTSTSAQQTDSFNFVSPTAYPNPIEPGNQLTITIDTTTEGDFTPFIQKYKNNQDFNGNKTHCPLGRCNLVLAIPNDITSSSVDIGVRDFDGYAKTTPLSITNPNATPSPDTLQIQVTPSPTPTPTIPAAPTFPCAKPPTKPNETCGAVETAIGPITTDPAEFIKTIFTVLLSMAGGWATYLIVTAGYQLMFSQGDAEGVKEAQEKITSAVVGIIFMILSFIILRVIGVDIFQLPTFGP